MDAGTTGTTAPPRPVMGRPPAGVWRFTLPPADRAVPGIRHTVRDLLRRQQAPLTGDQEHAALLILSELVTNAVRHAALLTPEVGVEVAMDGRTLRISVEDGHPYRPKALDPHPERQHTSGRGLLLVKHLALASGGDCGVRTTATGGKVIWAALPLDSLP